MPLIRVVAPEASRSFDIDVPDGVYQLPRGGTVEVREHFLTITEDRGSARTFELPVAMDGSASLFVPDVPLPISNLPPKP